MSKSAGSSGGGGAGAYDDESGEQYGIDDGESDYYAPAVNRVRPPKRKKKKPKKKKKGKGKRRRIRGGNRNSGGDGSSEDEKLENFLRSTGKRFDASLEGDELKDEVYVQLSNILGIGFSEVKALQGAEFAQWLKRASNPLACFLIRIGCVASRLVSVHTHTRRSNSFEMVFSLSLSLSLPLPLPSYTPTVSSSLRLLSIIYSRWPSNARPLRCSPHAQINTAG